MERAAIYVTILTRILKWKFYVYKNFALSVAEILVHSFWSVWCAWWTKDKRRERERENSLDKSNQARENDLDETNQEKIEENSLDETNQVGERDESADIMDSGPFEAANAEGCIEREDIWGYA